MFYFNLINFYSLQGVNEILKFFSPNQLEDFKVKWSEVFQDRIEELEHSLCSTAKLKSQDCSKPEKLSNPKWINAVRLKSSKNSRLLNQIVSIETLADEGFDFSAKISERILSTNGIDINQSNMTRDSYDDEKIIEINISLLHRGSVDPFVYKTNQNSLNGRENATKLICKVGSSFLFREFNRKEAEKILIAQLKGWIKQVSLELKGNVRNKRSNTETQSCRDFSYVENNFDEKEFKATNNVVSGCVF